MYDSKEVGYDGDLKAFATWRAYVLVIMNFGFMRTCVCKNGVKYKQLSNLNSLF